MLTLGLNQDLYDCGVALSDGRDVLYSANEERFTREKNSGGLPRRALAALFAQTGLEPRDVERIAVVGEMTPPLPARAFPDLQAWVFRARRRRGDSLAKRIVDLIAFETPIANTSPEAWSRRLVRPLIPPLVRRQLPRALRRQPVTFVEHHRAHAACGFALSGFDEALVLTADGMGDGLSATVSRASHAGIERLWSASARDSFGLFFEMIADALDFIPSRDEGKLMALAASGRADRVAAPPPFRFADGRLSYDGPRGRRGVAWIRELVAASSREDVCAWGQLQLETGLGAVCDHFLAVTGQRCVVVAGGVFANVKLNQRLHEREGVEALFVCPNMGDGGLSLGAICAVGGLPPRPLQHVFWGDGFDDADVESALRDAGLRYRRSESIARECAQRLARGRVVARFAGRMEWGPRALGNRSILASASDPGITQRLNRLLARNDFMPFAPACLAEEADRWVAGLAGAQHAAEFMTVCFPCTDAMRAAHPAAVHVDGTARLQIVRRDTNPGLHAILSAYREVTGRGLLINTSLNIHHEPIVRTPEEAVSTFLRAGVDCLAAGPFLVDGPHVVEPG